MPNSNTPFGLGVVSDNGGPWTGQATLCFVPAAQAGNIFIGDPVVALGGGDAYGCASVGIATAGAGNPILGSVVGISNGPSGGGGNAVAPITFNSPTYRQGGVASYVLVATDPNQIYAIQEDSAGGAISSAVGAYANGNLVAGAGNTTFGISGWQLQSSSVSASANATYQLRLLGLQRAVDNAFGANAKWLVRLNLAQLWGASGV